MSSSSFADAGIGDLRVRRREPGLERRPAGLELGEPGAVAAQQVLGDEPLLVLERAHRGGVVDERELLADGDAGHRGRVLQRRQPDRAHDADGDAVPSEASAKPRGQPDGARCVDPVRRHLASLRICSD